MSETAGAVLHPEMTDEILPAAGETVDGVSVLYTYITMVSFHIILGDIYKILQPADNGRLQFRAWSDVTDAVFHPKVGYTTLLGEIVESVSVFWL